MKDKHSQEILIIAALTLTITLLWAYLSVHRALKKSVTPVLTPSETKVLDPKLDDKLLKELKERII